MPRTLADVFDEAAENDLRWREGELVHLKVTYENATEPAKATILRALVCLLYAHYEGFCKFVFQEWARTITRRCIRINDLGPPYQLIALRPQITGLPVIEDGDALVRAIEMASRAIEQRAVITSPLSTSNLWARVILEATGKFSLAPSAASVYNREVDLLVSRRNEIAHGETMAIRDLASYQTYEDAAFYVMMDLALLLSGILHNRTYLRTP